MIFVIIVALMISLSLIIVGAIMDQFRLKAANYKLGKPMLGKVTITGLNVLLVTSLGFLIYSIVYFCIYYFI